ncbi:4'-phosphopantetheinyl transferase family protein [Herbiconiux solani]|uniref:4'-phosphopantetheinyl transferase family protein n=1 Tax=Herbiconiux solani TaxID=661329 RepID=UPI00082587D1|nr:4'-phosphopantetheinyl transferase superfamily protein [Herbiconiux solani]
MDTTAGPGVLVRLRPDAGDRAADHAALAELVGAARIRHRCLACGADDHGAPEAVLADGGSTAGHVSLARAGGWVALATSSTGRVGVDIEEIARVAASRFDDVAFDDRERARLDRLDRLDRLATRDAENPHASQRMRARLWSAKEAILKVAGTGLRTDPRSLGIDPGIAPDDGPRTDARLTLVRSAVPGIRPQAIQLHEIDAPPGLVGFICILPDDAGRQSFGSALE